MQELKPIKDIVSSTDEYDELYNTDHLFILKGRSLDDNNLINVIGELEHYDWYNKLRGPADGPAKYHNIENNHEWLHGYIIAVSCDNLTTFEKSAILVGMKHGYTFEKLDVFQTKKELKDNHFSSLFEEV
jgi:hypothetical protein